MFLASCRFDATDRIEHTSPELQPPLQSMTKGDRHTSQAGAASSHRVPSPTAYEAAEVHHPGFPTTRFVPLAAFLTLSGAYSFHCRAGLFHPADTPGVRPSGLCSNWRSVPLSRPILSYRCLPTKPHEATWTRPPAEEPEGPITGPEGTENTSGRARLQRFDPSSQPSHTERGVNLERGALPS